MLSGRGLCDELITRPEKSYRLCCVVVCDLENLMNKEPYPINVTELNIVDTHWIYFLHAINSDRQTRLLNVLGQIAMILGDKKKSHLPPAGIISSPYLHVSRRRVKSEPINAVKQYSLGLPIRHKF